LVRHGDYSGRRIQIAQAYRDRMRTNFPRRPRLPTTAKILDIDRAFDSQARAIILRAFAHVTAQQRRLVFSLGDPAAFEQLAHQQARSLSCRQWRISRSLKLSARCCSYNATAFSAVSVSPFISCEPTTYGFPQTVGRPT